LFCLIQDWYRLLIYFIPGLSLKYCQPFLRKSYRKFSFKYLRHLVLTKVLKKGEDMKKIGYLFVILALVILRCKDSLRVVHCWCFIRQNYFIFHFLIIMKANLNRLRCVLNTKSCHLKY